MMGHGTHILGMTWVAKSEARMTARYINAAFFCSACYVEQETFIRKDVDAVFDFEIMHDWHCVLGEVPTWGVVRI
jgi:hypothetical protein